MLRLEKKETKHRRVPYRRLACEKELLSIMEKPYNGQAILNDTFNELEIIIPTKKNWLIIVFLGAWLGGWTMGEFLAIRMLIGSIAESMGFVNLFLLFWLCGWTVGGFFALKTLLWNLIGKEIITVGEGRLTIVKMGSLLSKPKTYDLHAVKNLRVNEEGQQDYGAFFGGRNSFAGMTSSTGTIRFDYGFKTIKFASGIDEAEANFIIGKLKSKRLISETNL
ncbi:hypothetical protein IQ13_3238 [Lacibacter cauensis]|uniref:Uncharacterized protein n=2 Tax=Lacibacter cauensis TaxID=510947 RepID=A0A562SIJ6_9BACT|nr:hypothetical protein IQ13_3238 [Lacibacter cauensis]